MKILVDADACPVVKKIESVAWQHQIPVILFCDTSRILQSSYSQIEVVGAGPDAVDFALIKECAAGDIVITQDYGLAAMALSKKAYALRCNGMRYTDENIVRMLEERHIVKKVRRTARMSALRGLKMLGRRIDGNFRQTLDGLILEVMEKETEPDE